MRWVGKRSETDCCIATLAMFTGRSYEQVWQDHRALFDRRRCSGNAWMREGLSHDQMASYVRHFGGEAGSHIRVSRTFFTGDEKPEHGPQGFWAGHVVVIDAGGRLWDSAEPRTADRRVSAHHISPDSIQTHRIEADGVLVAVAEPPFPWEQLGARDLFAVLNGYMTKFSVGIDDLPIGGPVYFGPRFADLYGVYINCETAPIYQEVAVAGFYNQWQPFGILNAAEMQPFIVTPDPDNPVFGTVQFVRGGPTFEMYRQQPIKAYTG